MLQRYYYKVTGDLPQAPLEVTYPKDDLENAEKKKQQWLADPDVFNVTLWKVTIIEEIV